MVVFIPLSLGIFFVVRQLQITITLFKQNDLAYCLLGSRCLRSSVIQCMNLGKLQEIVRDREAWQPAVHGSQRVRYN